METGERLAAYLAGELDADEARQLEADLARDAALRARLDRLRRLDAAFTELPEVTPPAAFSGRLRSAVDDELARLERTRVAQAGADELAVRRARRSAWRRPIAIAAAAAATIGIVGVGLTSLGGGDGSDDMMATQDTAGDTTAQAEMAPDDLSVAPETGPAVVSAGRSFDADSLADLRADPRFDAVVLGVLDQTDASTLAQDFTARFLALGFTSSLEDNADIAAPDVSDGANEDAGSAGDDTAGGAAADEDSGEDRFTDDRSASEPTAAGPIQIFGADEADLADVRACLPTVLEAAPSPVIPMYAELATFENEPSIVYALASLDPDTETYNRVEIWVVGRSGDCLVRHFTQLDR